MQVTIVGLPGPGKSTVFNARTGAHAETGGYSGGRAAPNVGVVKVPDARVEALAELFQPKKKTLAEITFSDVAAEAGGGGSARGLARPAGGLGRRGAAPPRLRPRGGPR